MTIAAKAKIDKSVLGFAVTVTEFSRCTVYDFADGSYLTAWDNGRIEVDTITP